MPNGLTVLMDPQETTGVVGVGLLVRCGVADETRPGQSFFLARLLARALDREGAKRFGPLWPQAARRIGVQWLGGGLFLSGTVLPSETPALLSLFGTLARKTPFAPEEVEAVRPRLVEEARQHRLDPYRLALDALRQSLYRTPPYGRPRLEGSPESLQAITLEELVAFHRRTLIAARMVLALAGDLKPSQAQEWVRAALGPLPRGDAPKRPFPSERIPPAPKRLLLVQGAWSPTASSYSYIAAAFVRPPGMAETLAVEAVLQALLAGPKGRLLQLAGRTGIAIDAVQPGGFGVSTPLWLGQGPFYLYALIQPYILDSRTGEVRLALEEVRSAWARLLREVAAGQFTREEVARARQVALGQYALRYERMQDRALWLAWGQMSGQGALEERVFRQIPKVSREEVLRYARRWMAAPQVALVVPAP